MKIDFVIPWVDGNDPIWQKEKAKYDPSETTQERNGACRYRDWDNLKYWFRSVEQNAPWVNQIHFITCGQIPEFLNLNHPKVHFVRHEDYIPAKYLPTFSANPIELNLHRIRELSEFFVYFNDDFFINRPLNENFFFKKGKPRYFMCDRDYNETELTNSYQHMRRNGMTVINRHFTHKTQRKSGLNKVASVFYGRVSIKNLMYNLTRDEFGQFNDLHLPDPFLKSTLQEVWDKEYEVLDMTCRNRIRTERDVNQYVFRYWDLARGNFEPRSIQGIRYDVTSQNISECVGNIRHAISPTICINDSPHCDNFSTCKEQILNAFAERYPYKSSFEN